MSRCKLINKKALKKAEGKCYFCDMSDYESLQVHRIHEGADGGKYTMNNCLVLCANCHTKVTAGKIKTHRKYLSSSGRWILHYTDENGIEHYN